MLIGGTTSGATGTVQTSLHGHTSTSTITLDSSADGFTGTSTSTTPNGTIIFGLGGTNTVNTSNSKAGENNVNTGEMTVLSGGTDSGIPVGAIGKYQSFEKATGSEGTLNLQYASFGVWQVGTCTNPNGCSNNLPLYAGTTGGAALGQSLTATMPVLSGYATYWGGSAGFIIQPVTTNSNNIAEFYGTVGLAANLGTGAIIGQISNINAYSTNNGGTGQNLIGTVNDINLSGTISGSGSHNTYTGTATASSTSGGNTPNGFDITGSSGSLIGGFYGPNAEETAGTFYMTVGANSTELVGSFGAARGLTTLTSTHFDTSVTLAGSPGVNLTATLNAPDTTAIALTVDSSPDGFTKYVTHTTPGNHTIVVVEGGALDYSASTTQVGQSNVVKGNLGIVSSTDPAITAGGSGGGGNWELFANTVGLQYANFGVWSISPCSNGGNSNCTPTYVGASAGAIPGVSETSSMPTTGPATFTGGATGYVLQPVSVNSTNAGQFYGTATLTANFTNGGGTISGSVTGINAYSVNNQGNNPPTLLGTVNNITLSATIGGSEYTGTASAVGAAGALANGQAFNIGGSTGSLKGAFYGPTTLAAPTPPETAGVFNLSASNGTVVMGSFGAKQATPSDRRLKHDITPAGTLPNGLKLYSWRYLGGSHRFTGVMAQDLLADARFAGAVAVDTDGLMRVDYGQLGYSPADLATMQAEGEAAVALYHRTLH
jgi:hypothetical protein